MVGNWFNVPRLAVVVREEGHWGCSETMIREVGLDSCSRAHYCNFNIETRMFPPSGELQHHALPSPGLKRLASRGRWKRESNLGFKWDKWFFMVFTGHLADSGKANIFPSDSSSALERPPWWFFVAGNEPGNSREDTCKIDRLVFLRMYKNSLGRHLI